ncbi:MAG TPA: MFS transporter [Candidatus Saccharimonadia bacterium]
MLGHRNFSALRNYNYRIYFTGMSISLIGTWAQVIALSWLVLQMTGSGTALGLIHAAHFLPLLILGPWGGLVADRRTKHKLLLATQASSAILSLLLGVLVVTGTVQLWMVFVITLGLGLVRVVDHPTRQALIFEMAGKDHVQNAMVLQGTSVSVTRMLGPAIAGVLIATLGIGMCFIINAFSYIPMLVAMALLKVDELEVAPLIEKASGQLREGFRYVMKTPVIRNNLIMMAIIGTLAYEWAVVLPLLASFTFHGEAADYALLMTALGIGATIGGLYTARYRSVTQPMISLAALMLGAMVVLVALAPSLLFAVVAMGLVGFFAVQFDSLNSSILQLTSSPEMRGRVMALWGVAFLGSSPIGGPLIGWICQLAGPRTGLLIGAVAAMAAATFGYVTTRRSSVILKT